MIANMNEKGRQTKLLAAVAIFAMVVCVFAVVMPSEDVTGATINVTTTDDLNDKIAGANAGDIIQLAAGTYNIEPTVDVEYGDQYGWYLLINKSITLQGDSNGGTILMSDAESANGNWSTQNFITVTANNVTIKDLTILGKEETNKHIEVLGDNFTLQNVVLGSSDRADGGSLIFNTNGNTITKATVEDVTIYNSWISSSYNTTSAFNLSLKDVTIDNTKINADTSGNTGNVGYVPLNLPSNKVTVNCDNVSILVKDWKFINNYTLPAGATMTVSGTLTIGDKVIFKAASGAVTTTGEGKIVGNITTTSTSDDGTSSTISPAEGTTIDSDIITGAFSDANVNTVTITAGTISNTLDLTSSGLTTGDKIVLGSDVQIANNTTFTIPVGVSIEYSTTVAADTEHSFTVTANGSSATFKNFSGNYTVKGGSIVVSGNGTGVIEAADGSEIKFTGNVSGDIQVSWTDSGVSPGKVIFDNATISSNCTITLEPNENITYSVEGELRIYGTIESSNKNTQISIKVDDGNTVKSYASATIRNGVYFEGTGDIDLGSSMSTGYWSEDIASDMTWSQAQKTIINGTMTIKSGYTLKVLGELVIDEGVTVYIEKGAALQIGDDRITAVGITVNGNIEVAQSGNFVVENAKDVTVSGQIYSEGEITIKSNVTVKSGGSIVIDESVDETAVSSITVTPTNGQTLTIEAGGSITISSQMDIEDIKNMGTINLDGAILKDESTIHLVADGAVVNIDSITGSTGTSNTKLIVNDIGLVFDKKNDIGVKTNEQSNAFSVEVNNQKGISGIVLTESVTSEKIGKDTKYSNSIYISGNVTAVNEAADATAENTKASFVIRGEGMNDGAFIIGADDSLNLGTGVTMSIKKAIDSNAASELYVYGTLTATSTSSAINYDTNGTSGGAEVYVSGTVTTLNNQTAIEDNINAFHYTGTDVNKYQYYTTLTKALAGSTDIEYIGDVEVMENATIPANTKVTAKSTATMVIGDEDNRNVTLTVANGGSLRNGPGITVNGTLVFENNKSGEKGNNIVSDVQIFEDPKMTYTNIYTALSNASSGKVEIRQDASVILDSDIEIKEGVTLVIPDSATVTMYNGVTMTVNGTVENSGDILNAADPDSGETAAGFNPMNGDQVNSDASKIVVNGAFKSMDYTNYANADNIIGYYIPGAYYQIIDTDGSWYWITPVEDAAAVAANVDDGIEIFGDVTIGDVTFAGSTEEGAENVVITVTGNLTAGTVTLTDANLVINGQYNGAVATAVGTIDLVNIKGVTISDAEDADDKEIMTIAGTPAKANVKGADATVTVSSGNVAVIGSLKIETYDENSNPDGIKSFTISGESTVTVMDVSGTGAQGELKADNFTVNGTLVAIDGGNVEITGTLTVRGTFTVATEDKENDIGAGTASVKNLLIGIAMNYEGKYGDASAATVNADSIQNLASIVMSAESIFTGKQVESMKPTEFYIEDALWITAYGAGYIATADTPTYYGFQPADITESKFIAWNNADGKAITETTAVGTIDKVYADIQYDVYKVVVIVDSSIGSVAIDGQMLIAGDGGYVMPGSGADALLNAGQHIVSYTLKASYEGEATLSSSTVSVSGLNFTLSGDFEDANGDPITYYLSLGGATPSSGQTVVIEGGSNGGSDGLGLTDYLLIILVILIVIMAIMVAFRLMRS